MTRIFAYKIEVTEEGDICISKYTRVYYFLPQVAHTRQSESRTRLLGLDEENTLRLYGNSLWPCQVARLARRARRSTGQQVSGHPGLLRYSVHNGTQCAGASSRYLIRRYKSVQRH